MTSAELLAAAREVIEPLFHEPPLGPVPDYLDPHGSVFGCVAEYEDRLEELDRWKAGQLSRWLGERVGCRWCVEGRVYELEGVREGDGSPEAFHVRLIEDEAGREQSLLDPSEG